MIIRRLIFTVAITVCLLNLCVYKTPAQQLDTSIPSDIHREIERQRLRLNSNKVEERRDALHHLAHIARPDSSRAALQALKDRVPIVRAAAVRAVIYLPSIELGPHLIPLLQDRDEFVRRETAYAFGEAGHRVAAPALITTLERDKKASVRAAAAIALGKIGDPTAESSLIEIINSWIGSKNTTRKSSRRKREDDGFVLRSVVISLGELKSRTAVPVIVEVLSSKKSSDDLRRESARALGLIGDPSAIPALRTVLNSPDAYLSNITHEALLRLSSLREDMKN